METGQYNNFKLKFTVLPILILTWKLFSCVQYVDLSGLYKQVGEKGVIWMGKSDLRWMEVVLIFCNAPVLKKLFFTIKQISWPLLLPDGQVTLENSIMLIRGLERPPKG